MTAALNAVFRDVLPLGPGECFLRLDGAVALVQLCLQRSVAARPLDLVVPCFPLTRSGWRPAYERHVFFLRRLHAETAEIVDLAVDRGVRETVFLLGIPETLLNELWRRAEFAVHRHTHPTPVARF